MSALDEPCVKLPWDSAFFGISVARVIGDTLDEAREAAIDDWCRAGGVKCLYFLARSDDPATLMCAQRCGYRLVDVRMEYEHQLTGVRSEAAAPVAGARPATAADVPVLEAMARGSFTDSRFYADGQFPRAKCDELYARWVAASCDGTLADVVLVLEQEGRVAAFVTCKLEEEGRAGRIGLVGVAAGMRGRGLGRQIIRAAQAWFAGRGARCVRVVTQARNIASQRADQRCGFVISSVGFYFHKWY